MVQSVAEQLKRGFRHLLRIDLVARRTVKIAGFPLPSGVALTPAPRSETHLGEFSLYVWEAADDPKLLLGGTRRDADGI